MIPLWADSNNWATIKITTNQAIDLLNSMTNAIVPIGATLPFFGNPNDPLLFDASGVGVAGSAMERFALCHGQGLSGSLLKNFDGTTRSTAPNIANRFLYGYDPTAPALGSTGGVDQVTLTAEQSGLRDHVHTAKGTTSSIAINAGAGSIVPIQGDNVITGVLAVDGVGGRNGAQGALQPHTNMPPYMVSAYIIRYK